MRGSTGTKNYLAQTQTIRTSSQAILELNQNRWHTIDPVSDSVYAAGSYLNYFKNKFSFEDVVLPNRPVAGAVRPRFGRYSSKVQRGATLNNIESVGTYNSTEDYWTMPPRLYTVTTEPVYKYFTSQDKTGTYGFTYTTPAYVNKVVVGIENTFEWPLTWVIQVKISGTWTTIATNPAVDPTTTKLGQVSVYRVGGSWTTTEPASPALADAVAIQGIQIITYTMNLSTAHINIIEMSGRLQADVSSYLQSWNYDESLSAADLLAPVGAISSNGGAVTFSNNTQEWEKYLTPSGPALKDFAVDDTMLTIKETINSETFKIVTAYCKDWNVSEGDSAKANLFDKSVFAQEVSCPDLLMANVSPTLAAVRLLDQIGMAGYKIRRVDNEVEPILPYFFCDKDQNVWEVLQDLCYGQQYAIWIDSDNDINIATKNWIYNNPKTAVWSFRAENDGASYADIESHDMTTTEPVNSVTINFSEQLQSRGAMNNTSQYLTAGLATGAVADVEFQTRNLWDSNRKEVLLGCVNVTKPIADTDTTINVDVNAFRNDLWDFPPGYAYIDEEVIKLGAARFGYVNTAGAYTTADLETVDDWKLMMANAIGNVSFTGQFVNCERGQFGTTAANHSLTLSGWNYVTADAKSFTLVQNSVGNGFMRINKSNAAVDYKTSIWRDLGTAYGAFYTRFSIINQATPQRAGGVVLWASTASNALTGGWYVEFRSSEKQVNEIAIVRIKSTGALDRANQQVFSTNISESVFYDVKIVIARSTMKGYHRISVYLGGVRVAAAYVLTSLVTPTTKVALMATGRSIVQFDYLSAANGSISASTHNAHISDILKTMLEEKKGAYQGLSMYFANFDSKLRGIYVETARLSNAPALRVSMFPTINDPGTDKTQQGRWIAKSNEVVPALDSVTPFSAKLAIGNVASRPVALDDGSASIYPYLYGPILEESTTIKVTSKNDAAIRAQGEKKLELSPKWIPTRKNAQDLADYIASVKGYGMETHSINCFDNPLIQIGDQVTIYYPRRGLNYDHTYIVTNVSRSEDTGITTSVKLVKIA